LVVASGLLALSVLAGIVPAETDGSLTVFSLRLESPEKIPTIFFVISIYALWQFWSSWLVQGEEVRVATINRVDVVFSFVIALTGWAVFLWPLIHSFLGRISVVAVSGTTIAVLLGAGIAYASFLLEISSRLVKRKIVRSEMRTRLNQVRADHDDQLFDALVKGSWELVYNPDTKKAKGISFQRGGTIGRGKNNNEYLWRVKNGNLEIINSDGMIFSRFKYIPSSQQFEHTNDEDTLSIRSQVIRPGGA
jgi:hypothetical protein